MPEMEYALPIRIATICRLNVRKTAGRMKKSHAIGGVFKNQYDSRSGIRWSKDQRRLKTSSFLRISHKINPEGLISDEGRGIALFVLPCVSNSAYAFAGIF